MHTVLVFLATALLIIVATTLNDFATAGSQVVRMGDGDRVEYRCDGGTLSQPQHTGSMWRMTCTKVEGPQPPEPPIEPPSQQCGSPDFELWPSSPQSLPQQEFVNVHSHRVRVYRFNSSTYQGTWGVSIAPTPRPSGKPSNSNMTVLSECPGFLDVDIRDPSVRSCWQAGNQNNIQWRVGSSTSSRCGLKPNTIYYINTAPINPVTGRDTCGGVCSIVVNSGRR